ncbi:MAG TPA: YidB family protein [Rhizomicrobium sp.]|nr:YidB family protein [Rhizomicrobium sp.]
MGLFDGLLGGIVGAEMATVVNGLIERHGGVQGVVNQLRSNGLGPSVNSWINEGPNAPVAPQDVHRAFGDQTMSELAAKSGMSTEELAQKLAQVLPHAVDALTPGGEVLRTKE